MYQLLNLMVALIGLEVRTTGCSVIIHQSKYPLELQEDID